jgi:shikimate kinase
VNRRRSLEAPVFLVGFMGAGKSTVGRSLAEQLGWDFADTDALVERTDGRAIDEIFRASGEGKFRELEWDALRSLAGRKQLVVATGGGLFLGVVQRALIKREGPSCWLDATLPVVAARVGDTGSRPLFAGGDALALRSFFERRRAAYALADFRVDAATGDPVELARAVDGARRAFCR